MENKEEYENMDELEFDATEKDLLSSIESIVGENAYYETDSECVDDFADYESVIEDVLQFIGIEDVEIVISKATSTICLKLNDVSYSFYLNHNSDYIDADVLVKGINEFVRKIGKPGKLYWFWNCDWGQEMAFLYTEKTDEVDALMSVALDPMEYGEISDGYSH